MKKLILFLTALLFAINSAPAARTMPAKGRIVDQTGEAVEYATVVLLRDGKQVAGMATDNQGAFTLKVPAGEYILSVQYLGYRPIMQPVQVAEELDLGDLVLHSTATQIAGVEVRGQLIRREADRFVVDVANAPSAIGKDGIELLEHAPGIWIDNDKITINGKSGSKVYINDRELRMEPEQMLNYLRSLRAEQIQKIEVVPVTGADYDADSSGGIIRITLRKRRENGLDGSLSMHTRQSEIEHTYNPGGNINIHTGRLDLYASAWGYLGRYATVSDEQTRYDTRSAALASHSYMTEHDRNFGGSVGAVVELAPSHSIGAEFEYWRNNETGPNDTYTDFAVDDAVTRTDSRYDTRNLRDSYSATFNYIWKIDTLGSTLKLLADYTHRGTDARNDNRSRIAAPGATPLDSVYYDTSRSRYRVTTATLGLDKKFSDRWSLKAGAKYTYNDMHNDALYEYLRGGAWVRNDRQSIVIDYTEHIAAAYGTVSGKLGRWSLVAGLRGEYTHTYGKNSEVGQDYFSLFPNANLSYALTKDGAYSLIAQYARTIARPRFWSLNPQRTQISDYTYQIGNPSLEPAYTQEFSLTLVLKHKYTLTGGINLRKDEIQQTMVPDAQNPDMLALRWVNYDTSRNYYLTANLPFQLTKWWTLNANALYMRNGQRLEPDGEEIFQNFWRMNLSTTFTLPAKFYIDLGYRHDGQITLGNIRVGNQDRLEASVKKRFGDRFTVTFSAENLLNERQQIRTAGSGFIREMSIKQPWNNRTYRVGVTYNFKSGKAFKSKTVEAGSAEEKSRL